MSTLQVRDIDARLYESIRTLAIAGKRSISQEVISILEKYVSSPAALETNPTDEFLKLAGAWDDERSASSIVKDMKSSRKNSSRFGAKNELFD
jgi:hypothetical protein